VEGLQSDSSGKSVCIASVRPRVQTPDTHTHTHTHTHGVNVRYISFFSIIVTNDLFGWELWRFQGLGVGLAPVRAPWETAASWECLWKGMVTWRKESRAQGEASNNLLLSLTSFFLVLLGFKLRALCLWGRCAAAWAMPAVLFVLIIFGDGSLIFCSGWLEPRSSRYLCFLPRLGWQARATTTTFLPLREVFLRGLFLNLHPPDLSFPHSWDDRLTPPHSAIGWDWVSRTLCLGLA
jgi:hypothetical protein